MKFFYILLALITTLLLPSVSMAQLSMMHTKIDSVDVQNKTVTIQDKVYPYEMVDIENMFYTKNGETQDVNKLSKVKKYYVSFDLNRIRPNSNFRTLGTVVYIGEVESSF